MKYLFLLPLTLLCVNLNAQSEKLPTFEEMWVVAPEFLNMEVGSMISLAPESMTYEQFHSIKSFEDLNKIIADTPFLSLRLQAEKTGISKDIKRPTISLGKRCEAGTSLKGWGSWLVVFRKGEEIVLGIPTSNPAQLQEYLSSNNFTVSDQTGKLQNMTIKEIRIENGTYGKTK